MHDGNVADTYFFLNEAVTLTETDHDLIPHIMPNKENFQFSLGITRFGS